MLRLLLLVALHCILLVEGKCYGRDNKNGICARIKDNQFQIQGVTIVDASQKVHEDIEGGRYQPRSEIRRQEPNSNYQDEPNYPQQAGGGTVGEVPAAGDQSSFTGGGVVPQQAPSIDDGGGEQEDGPSIGTTGGGGEGEQQQLQQESFGVGGAAASSGEGGGGDSLGEGTVAGGLQQQSILNQGGSGDDSLPPGLGNGGGAPQGPDGQQYRTGPPGKKGRGRGGKKGKKTPPGIAPPEGGAGAEGGGGGDGGAAARGPSTGFISNAKDPHNIHEGKMGAFASAIVGKYYYAPKQDLPLPKCFHNPTGYVCCNFKLNSIMETTYKALRKNPKFNSCNVGVIATAIQKKAEEQFKTPFESIAALEDFAQKVHFSGDMVCKIEIDGKYILAYATPYMAEQAIDPEVLAGHKKIDNEEQPTGGGPGRNFLVQSLFI